MNGGPTSFRWERLPSCRRGVLRQVKHAEQVRYEPREACAKTPFWIAFLGGDLMAKSACHFGLTLQEAAWLLGLRLAEDRVTTR